MFCSEILFIFCICRREASTQINVSKISNLFTCLVFRLLVGRCRARLTSTSFKTFYLWFCFCSDNSHLWLRANLLEFFASVFVSLAACQVGHVIGFLRWKGELQQQKAPTVDVRDGMPQPCGKRGRGSFKYLVSSRFVKGFQAPDTRTVELFVYARESSNLQICMSIRGWGFRIATNTE